MDYTEVDAVRTSINNEPGAQARLINLPSDLEAIRPANPTQSKLGTPPPRASIQAAHGRANASGGGAGASGGLISPLAETAYSVRTYWPTPVVIAFVSADGLHTGEIELPAVKTITMSDAVGKPMVLRFAEPE